MIHAGVIAAKVRDNKDITRNEIKHKIGSCFYLHEQGNIYMLTINTLTKNAIETIVFLEDSGEFDNINFDTVNIIDEFDLSIYKVKNELKDTVCETRFKIPSPDEHCTVVSNILQIDDMQITENNFQCVVKCVSHVKLSRYACPSIPIIELEIININDSVNIDCLGGSPVTYVCDGANYIIGMVHSYDRKKRSLCVIPIYVIVSALRFSISDKEYKPSSIFIDVFQKNELELLSMRQVSFQTLDIQDAQEIHDAIEVQVSYSPKIKKYDKILQIDDNKIYNNGYIHCKNMNILVPYDTYIMLNQTKKDISLIVQNNKTTKIKTIQSQLTQLDSVAIIPLSSKITINWGGLILVELSEDTINHYASLGFTIKGYANDIRNKKYTKIQHRSYFAVIKINWSEITDEESHQYLQHGFPLIVNNNEYIIPLLFKVNNKKINCVDDLLKANLLSSNSTELSFVTYTSQKITIDKKYSELVILQNI